MDTQFKHVSINCKVGMEFGLL